MICLFYCSIFLHHGCSSLVQIVCASNCHYVIVWKNIRVLFIPLFSRHFIPSVQSTGEGAAVAEMRLAAFPSMTFIIFITCQCQRPKRGVCGGLIFSIFSNIFETLILPLSCPMMSSDDDRVAQYGLVACSSDCSFHFTMALNTILLQCLYMQTFNLYILYLLKDILLGTDLFSTPMNFFCHV